MVDRWLLALKYTYGIGLIGAFTLALTGRQDITVLRDLLGDRTGYLKYFGIAHMLLLCFLGFMVSRPGKPVAGSRIQTAGYLHTLIGFAAALLVLNAADAKLNTLVGLLGNALFTSILGWAVGSEIVDAGGDARRRELFGDATGDVAKEFEGFADGVRRVHAAYLTALRGAVAELRKEADTLKDAKAATDALGRNLLPVAEASESLLTNLRELASRSREAKDGLRETAAAARETATYLKESRVLIAELERLLEFVRSRPGGAHYGGS